MNNEIKEILDELKEYASGGMSGLYPAEQQVQHLLDYITNLQTIEREYSAILSENADLQQENERLKQPQIFIDTEDMEERYGRELYEDYLKEQLEDYKSRCEKASEILHNLNDTLPLDLILSEIDHSENILQNGSDKDE